MLGVRRIGASCGRAHARWCSEAHAALVDSYRAARSQWEEGQGSGREVYQAPGAAGSLAVAAQLEDDDYRAMFPPPTFRAWLEANRGSNTEDSSV